MKRKPPGEPKNEVTRLRRRVSDLTLSERGFRQSLRTAEASRRFAEAIFHTVREPMLILDARLRVLAANRSFYRAFRAVPAETLERFVYDLGDGRWNIARLRLLLEKVLPQDRVFEGFDVEYDIPRGGRRVMVLNGRRIEDGKSNRATILLAFEDVTDQRRAQEELQAVSVTDPLTGMRNRRGLQAAAGELARQLRGTGRDLVVMFLDIDHLKAMNDRFGHEEGDRLLLEAARLIHVTFPEARIIARVGGDEFVAVFVAERASDPEEFKLRLRKAIALDNRERERPLPLSISSGIALGDAGSFERTMAQADAAMYEEKLGRRKTKR